MKTKRETDWELEIGIDDALRGQGADAALVRERRPALIATTEAALTRALPLLQPVVVHHEENIVAHGEDSLELEQAGAFACGPHVAARLATAERLVAAVCTIGGSLEDDVARTFGDDPVTALAIDGVGSAAIDKLAAQACRRFQTRARQAGLRGAVHCWPGSPEWPAEIAQPQVFALVDPYGEFAADVRLLPSFVMRPLKSLTLVLGLTRRSAHRERECDVCALRDSCRYRAAGRV